MSITERLANMPIWAVIVTVLVLIALRFALLRLRTPAAKSAAEIAESLAVAMALVFLLIRPFIVQAFFIPSASMHPTLLEDDHILVNKFIYRFQEPKLGDVIVFKAPLNATPDLEDQIRMEGEQRGLEGKELSDYIQSQGNSRERDFIKRVIAVPGDTVRITPGYVLVGEVQYDHTNLKDQLSDKMDPSGDRAIKLMSDKILADGHPINKAEIAAAVGQPNAKVKIFPGTVYLNGKALVEPYTAEDPEKPYPMSDTPKEWVVTQKVNGHPVQVVKIPKGRMLVMGDNRNNSGDARFWGLLERERVLGKAMFVFWPITRIKWIH
jgi:signal peptidase I